MIRLNPIMKPGMGCLGAEWGDEKDVDAVGSFACGLAPTVTYASTQYSWLSLSRSDLKRESASGTDAIGLGFGSIRTVSAAKSGRKSEGGKV